MSCHTPDNAPARRRAEAGFTLLELMVTVAVAAILITVAVPAWQGMVQRNTMTSAVNDLVSAINYARSEAITRGDIVYLCKSANQRTCTNQGHWTQGWIVYPKDPSKGSTKNNGLIQVHAPLHNQITLMGNFENGDINFGPSGFANENGTFTFKSSSEKQVQLVCVSNSGRTQVVPAEPGKTCGDIP